MHGKAVAAKRELPGYYGPRIRGQLCLLPSVETSDDVGHVVSRTLQKARRDHAAVAALAVHRNRCRFVERRQPGLEAVQRIPVGALDMSRVPFALAAHVQHLKITTGEMALEF